MRDPSEGKALDSLRGSGATRPLAIGRTLRLLLAVVLAVLSLALIVAGLIGKQEDGRNGAKAGAGVVVMHGHQLQPRVGICHVVQCPAAQQVRA